MGLTGTLMRVRERREWKKEKTTVFEFHINALHLKQVIAKCMISMFKQWQLLSSTHIFVYHNTSCWVWL